MQKDYEWNFWRQVDTEEAQRLVDESNDLSYLDEEHDLLDIALGTKHE